MIWLLLAQLAIAPAPIDTSQFARTGDVAAVISAQPPTCTTPPAADTLLASAGTGTACTPRADASRQSQIPPATAVTASDGSFSGTWSGGVTLPAIPTRGVATIFGTTAPYLCQLGAMTTTGFNGKCWALVSTTLPAAITAVPGLVLSPVANPAAGLTVNVFARY